jgi:hypothetical protein
MPYRSPTSRNSVTTFLASDSLHREIGKASHGRIVAMEAGVSCMRVERI